MSSCVLIGDEGSLSADYQIDLFTSEAPRRINQHDYLEHLYLFRKARNVLKRTVLNFVTNL